MTTHRSLVVIGGGLTGLAAAWKAGSQGLKVTLIERAPVLGGLAATSDWDGWRFDFGPHNFHTADSEIVDFYKSRLPDRFLRRELDLRLHIFGKLVPYPLVGKEVLLLLSGRQAFVASIEFCIARIKALLLGLKETDQLEDWILDRFGRTIYEVYFHPYIKRVWKTEPRRLSKIIGEQRIPMLRIRDYLAHEIFKQHKPNPEDLTQWDFYYVKHGIGQLSRYFSDRLEEMDNVTVMTGVEVTGLTVGESRVVSVETTDGSVPTSGGTVVSTIPINLLCRMLGPLDPIVRDEVERLEYCSERFLFVKLRTSRVSGFDWTYFSGAEQPFTRVSEFNYDKFEMVPQGKCSLTFEFPCNEGDREWTMTDDELVDWIVPLYAEVFPLHRADIVAYRSAFQRFAYPRFVVGYDRILRRTFEAFDALPNLMSIGRQGMFSYINTDGATRMGFDAADAAVRNEPNAKCHRALLRRFHRLELRTSSESGDNG